MKTVDGKDGEMKTEIKIDGMNCVNCVRHVTEALQSLPGVEDINVDLPTGKVTFEKLDSVTVDDIANAVQGAGYKVMK